MKQLYYIALLATLLSGCSNEQETDLHPNSPQEFRFQSFLKEGDKISPLSKTRALAGNLAEGYKLIGILSNTNYDPNGNNAHIAAINTKKIFWETQTTKEGAYNEGARFWISDGNIRHSFYAYSTNPTGTTSENGVTKLYGMDNTSAALKIDFKQSDDPTQQIDLLVATPVLNIQTSYATPIVNFYFRHCLSRIVLKLMGSGGVSLLDCQASVKYTNIKNAGTITLPKTIALANDTRHDTEPQILKPSFIFPSSATNNENALLLGDLILLPQSGLSEGFIEVILTYYIKSKAEGGTLQTASISLPGTSLLSETQYSYLLNIIEETQDLTISNITLEAWQAESKIVDTLD